LSDVPSGVAHVGRNDRPARAPHLGLDEIHVWTVVMEGPMGRCGEGMDTLTPSERAQAARFRSDVDAARFVRRRLALREIVGRYLGIAAGDLVFTANEYGKPSLLPSTARPDLAFNASHSGAIALIAIGRAVRIGVDVERLRPDVEALAIATRFFASEEVASLEALGADDRVAAFFNAWTRKEAVVKALGGGLSIPLDAFAVSVRPREPPAILRWNIASGDEKRWRLHHLDAARGYVGALADDAARVCRFFDWTG